MSYIKEIAEAVALVREKSPLVHCITNYVTVNDCANALYAIGASPIMADDVDEVEDITSIASALVINIGTLNSRTIESAVWAGKKANELNIPIVFDPVGAGASGLRNATTDRILQELKVSVIRGNLSELSFIAGLSSSTKGVDSSEADMDKDPLKVAEAVAKRYNCTAALTGQVDVVTDGNRYVRLSNGTPMLSGVTGSGCLTTALLGAFVGATGDGFISSCGAVLTTSIAGEQAQERAGSLGTGSFHMALIDYISLMNGEVMEKLGKIEVIK